MDLIKKAKEHLILYHPFFAYLALQVEFVREDEIGTSSIDGIVFRYNEKWLEEHDHRWCAGLLAHGMGHVLLLHPLRAEGKNIERWNKACDYAVNSLMIKSSIGLINDLYKVQYENLDTEQIYELLKGEDDKPEDEGNSDNDAKFAGTDGTSYKSEDGSDICKVAIPDMTETPESELESIITQKIMDAATQAEFGGDGMTDAIKEIVNEIKEPKKDWKEILHKFTAEIARNDYDWQRPDTSYLQRNIHIPGLHNEEIGNIILAIDTSISMNNEILQEVLAEVKEAVEQMTEEVTVIHCDTIVRKVEQVQTEDVDKIVPEGRGGTAFLPVFKYIEDEDLIPKALIYFTDGKCYDTLIEPDYPTIWCVYENPNFKAQFGEAICVDD